MTPVQEAMCRVIKECGGWPVVDGLGLSNNVRQALSRCGNRVSINARTFYRNGMWSFGCTTASITVDGHNVTSQEYREWVEQQS